MLAVQGCERAIERLKCLAMFGDATSQLLAVVVLPAAAGLICIFVFYPQITGMATCGGKAPSAQPAANSSELFGVFSIADAYDTESCALWENQILVLKRIKARASVPELLELWNRYIHFYPELYEEISLWKWLAYLENCKLVERHGNGVQLTDYGCEFLRYLVGSVKTEGQRAQRP
jgi:hypothetical protein